MANKKEPPGSLEGVVIAWTIGLYFNSELFAWMPMAKQFLFSLTSGLMNRT